MIRAPEPLVDGEDNGIAVLRDEDFFADNDAVSVGEGATFFASLNAEAMEHVLRHVTARPHDDHWRNLLVPDGIALLLDAAGPVLSQQRSRLMTTVMLTARNAADVPRGTSKFDGRPLMAPDAVVFSAEEPAICAALVRNAGAIDCVHTLILDGDRGPLSMEAAEPYDMMWQAFSERGEQLHCLDVTFQHDFGVVLEAVECILTARAHQMLELSLTFTSCSASFLGETVDKFSSCANVEKLSVTMHSTPGARHVASLCAASLLELKFISDAPVAVGDLHDMTNACDQLERVHVECSGAWKRTAYAKVLIARGARLRYAHLGNMPADLCVKVRKACPNAKLCVHGGDEVDVRMRALGDSVVALSAQLTPDCGLDEARSGAGDCRGLESLELSLNRGDLSSVGGSDWSTEDAARIYESAEALFARSLPALRRLELRGYAGGPDYGGSLLRMAARSAVHLGHLTITGHLLDARRLKSFAHTPLREVIVHSYGERPVEDVVGDFVDVLAPWRRLQVLRIVADVHVNVTPQHELAIRRAASAFCAHHDRRKQIHVCVQPVGRVVYGNSFRPAPYEIRYGHVPVL